jgi:hypothetical protein
MLKTAALKTAALWVIGIGLALGGEASAAGSAPPHRGQSPWNFTDFEEPSSTFVVNDTDSSTIDRYLYRYNGSIVIDVPIRRYVGPTDSAGRLLDVSNLIERGIVGPTARVRLPAYDVDENSFPVADCDGDNIPDQIMNEVDKLYLNDEFLGTLRGNNEIWVAQSFDVPIRKLKFPSSPGAVAINRLRVDIDTANTDVVLSSGAVGCYAWAVSIDWIGLTFEAASPVVMVHGINSSGAAFVNFQRGLQAEQVHAVDSSIAMTDLPAPDPVPAGCPNIPYNNSFQHNVSQLRTLVPAIAERLGSETLHFVTHSKGGLDTRGFLSSTLTEPIEVRVGTMGGSPVKRLLKARSLVTLNTPHQGSVLAKYGVEARQLTWTQAVLEGLDVSAAKGFEGAYYCDLTPPRAAAFVASTTLLNGVQAASVATDADTNNNGEIEGAEATDFTGGATAADRLYQLIGHTADVTITVTPGTWRDQVTVTPTPTSSLVTNDVIVPRTSAAQYTSYTIDHWHHLNVHSEDNAHTIADDAQGNGLVNWRLR